MEIIHVNPLDAILLIQLCCNNPKAAFLSMCKRFNAILLGDDISCNMFESFHNFEESNVIKFNIVSLFGSLDC